MNKEINFMDNEKITGDAVIKRGYDIYDEWLEKKPSSRKIVDSVNSAVRAVKENKTKAASLEALAYLFALDMRIKERYKSILHCIFRYFSWRRETNALKQIKGIFHVAESEDIRTVIEIVIQNIRENIEFEEIDDADDEIHGGKKNGMTEEENTVSKSKQPEQTDEEIVEESSETEELETSEEKLEEKVEETVSDIVVEEQIGEQAIEVAVEQQNALEESPSKSEDLAQNLNGEKQFVQNENYIGNENNSSLENKSKPLENNNYIDPVDPFIFESEQKPEKKEGISFIDQIIMDNIINGRKDYVTHNPWEEESPQNENDQIQTNDSLKDEKTKDAAKNAHLYDSILKTENGAQKQNDITSQLNGAQPKVDAQNVNSPIDIKGKTDERVPIQVDITNDLENEYRREINNAMTDEMVLAMKARLEEAMAKQMAEADREQLKIESADLGMEEPAKTVDVDNVAEVKQTGVVSERK